jgi:hypothetical protein
MVQECDKNEASSGTEGKENSSGKNEGKGRVANTSGKVICSLLARVNEL